MSKEILEESKKYICSLYRGKSLNDTLMDCVPEMGEAEFISDKVSYEYAERLLKKQIIEFIEWYRMDDMSSFTPQHLADWFLKTKQQ